MHDFFVYDGKNSAEPDDRKFGNLQKYAQIVAKICDSLLDYKTYKVFFDKWFTRLNLLYHFRPKEIHAVGTIQLNRLQGGLLDVNIYLMKNDRDAMDYCCDIYSGLMAVKWVCNNVVNLTANFFGVEPNMKLDRWCGKEFHFIKTFHFLKLFNGATKAWEVSNWRTCCYHRIEYCARKSTGSKRYSSMLLIWQRSLFGSHTVITFVRMQNHLNIRNLCSNSVLR